MANEPQNNEQPIPRRLWRKVLHVFAVVSRFVGVSVVRTVLFVLIAAIAAVVVATQTGPGRALVLRTVIGLVNTAVLDADLRVGRLDGPVFGRITLVDVALIDVEGVEAVRAESLEVRYDLLALLDGQVVVDSVELRAPVVTVRTMTDGRLNLAALVASSDEPPKPPSGSGLLYLDIPSISLVDGRVDVAIASIVLGDLEVDASFSMDADGALLARVRRLQSELSLSPFGEIPLDIRNVEFGLANGTMTAGIAELSVGEAHMGGLRARLLPAEPGSAIPAFAASIDALRVEPALVGRLGLDIELKRTIEVSLEAVASQNLVEASIRLDGDSQIAARASFDAGPAQAWSLRLNAPALRPAEWVAGLGGLPADLRASVGVVANGRGIDPATMLATASVTGEGIEVFGHRIDDLRATASVAGAQLFVERFGAAIAGAELGLRGEAAADGHVVLSVDALVADAASVVASFVPGIEVGGRLGARLAADVTVDERLWALAASPDPLRWVEELPPLLGLALRVDAEDLVVPGTSVDELRVTVASTRGDSLAAVVNAHVDQVMVAGARVVDTATAKVTASPSGFRVTLDAAEAASQRSVVLRTSGRFEQSLITLLPEQLVVAAGELAVRLTNTPTWRLRLTESGGIGSVELGSTRIDAVGAGLALEGRWSPDGAIRATVAADGIDLAGLSDVFALPVEVAGRLTAALSLEGSLARPRGTAVVGWTDGAVGPVDGLQLDLRTSYGDSLLRLALEVTRAGVPMIVAQTGEGGLPVTFNLAEGGWRLRGRDVVEAAVTVSELDLAELGVLFPSIAAYSPSGRFGAVLLLSGTWGDPAIALTARGNDLAADVAQIGESTWRVDDVDFGVDVVAATGPGGNVGATVWVDEGGLALARATGAADIDVEALLAVDDILAAVQQAPIELELVVPGLATKRLPAEIREELGLVGGSVTARVVVGGRVGMPSVEVEAFADRVALEGLPAVSARLEAELDDALTLRALAVAGEAVMSDVWSLLPADDEARLAVLDDATRGAAAVRLDARLGQSLGEFIAEGVSYTRPVEARVHIPRGDLASLLPPDALALPGRVAGYLDIAGSILAPAVSGRLAWRDVTLANGAEGVIGIEVDARDMHADFNAFVCSGDARVLTADARLRVPTLDRTADGGWALPSFDRWGLQAHVLADAAPLAELVPAALIEGTAGGLEGVLDADIEVAGTIGAPRVEGDLGIREGAVTLAADGVRYTRVGAALHLSNDAIDLSSLTARSGNGSVAASGRIDLADFALVGGQVQAELDRFDASAFAGVGLVVGGDVTVDLAVEGDWLQVDVMLSDMAVDLPSSSSESGGGPVAPGIDINFVGEDVAIGEVGSRAPQPLVVEEAVDAGGSELRARIGIDSRGENTLKASVAEVEWDVDLDIEIDGDDMSLAGLVTVPSGRVTVAGKPFDITRGFVTFDGGANEIDPVVDIRAVHEFSADVAARLEPSSSGTANVTVVVDGTLSELTEAESSPIALVSDPEMTPEDIIFVLLTGRPRDDGGAVDAQQQALATAGSLMLGFLSDRIAGGLPIDTLRVSSDTQTGQAISRVEGGKYLSEDVYLSGAYINSQDPEENNFELSVEWIIARIGRATVGTSLRAGDRGRGGLELLYTLIRPGRMSPRVAREQQQTEEREE